MKSMQLFERGSQLKIVDDVQLAEREGAMPSDESRGPNGRIISPAEAAEAILLASPYHPIRFLKCRFEDGELTIVGKLPSFYLKQIAQIALQQLDGVKRISNIVEVSGHLL